MCCEIKHTHTGGWKSCKWSVLFLSFSSTKASTVGELLHFRPTTLPSPFVSIVLQCLFFRVFFALHSVCNFETFFADLVDLCLALCVFLILSYALTLFLSLSPRLRIVGLKNVLDKLRSVAYTVPGGWGRGVCDCQRIYLRFSPALYPSLTRINLNSTLLHGALALPM